MNALPVSVCEPTESFENRFATSLHEEIGKDVIANRLPAGLAAQVTLDEWGMFPTLCATVTECPVPVIDAAALLTRIPRIMPLNKAGCAIRQRLEEILRQVADGERLEIAVHFPKSLIAAQVKWLRGLAPGQVVEQWTAAEAPAATIEQPKNPHVILAELIRPRLAGQLPVDSEFLFYVANETFGGTQAGGAYVAKDAYEGMEAALHRQILDMGRQWAPMGTGAAALNILSHIETVADLLPTQTRRDLEMQMAEQFSTPAGLAFAAAWAADIGAEDIVFEPSAGTGALAVHARNAGAKEVRTNEISERRAAILRYLGFEPTKENAEQAHNLFSGTFSPTRILMNPPFSRSVSTGGRYDPGIAGEHVGAALKLLAPGGRLVAITSKRVSAWMASAEKVATLRANVLLSGNFFAAHGTHVETRILVFDKATAAAGLPITGHAYTTAELINLLAALRPDTTPEDEPDSDARFVAYHPAKLFDRDARPHPDQLVESHAMAAVEPPDITYRHHLPRDLIRAGVLSLPQLEAVVYAGQAHSCFITGEDGRLYRKGYFVGDGTGVGKGREIAGIIRDNREQGRNLAVWCTKDDSKLLAAAARDLTALGIDRKQVFSLRKYGLGTQVDRKEGIVVVGHGTLRSAKPNKPSRIDQLVELLGPDFDGVLVIDESHKLGNALDRKGPRGKQAASQVALAGIELQRRLPLARVVYVSATGASEAVNLAYADRLGLWGPGTPFASAADFVAQMERGGVAALEVIARDTKALGVFCARSLSFAGIRYERLVHELTPSQVALYDKLAESWQIVLGSIDAAMDESGSRSDGRARSAALSAFWGAQQRFFSQVLISLQMPSVLAAIEADMKAGYASVLQLVNTMEAAQNRALDVEGALDNLEDLDLTPREVLIQYLETSFPTRVYEEYKDAEGNTRTRPAYDSEGNPLISVEAVERRDELIRELGSLSVPQGPLEMLLDHFGADKVAEITGRNRRVVYVADEQTGDLVRKVERRSETARLGDMEAFSADEKRILVFSEAGGTGVDFHASLAVKNQRLRRHYVVQAGWNAKSAVQGLGRTNRTFQAQKPEYILVTTNLKGQMRFVTSIARRLDQLGALTKGQRDTGSVGLFSERDNLESSYAEEAVRHMIFALYHRIETVAGWDIYDFEQKMGLRLVAADGDMLVGNIPPVRQFLNRLLSLSVSDQNAVFHDFAERMEENIQAAIARGSYNVGVELYQADWVEEVAAPVTVYTHAESGARTSYVHLRAWHKRVARRFDRVAAGLLGIGDKRKILGWATCRKTGDAYAVTASRSITDQQGGVIHRRRLVGPFHQDYVDASEVGKHCPYEEITEEAAAKLWEVQGQDRLDSHDLHLLTGVLLPIWDRLKGAGMVYRVKTEGNVTYLGRIISTAWIRATLRALGANTAPWTPDEAVEAVLAGQQLDLANGWKLGRARVSGEYRIEVIGPEYRHFVGLRQMGMFVEVINYKSRVFMPIQNEAVVHALLGEHPIVELEGEAEA
jgi:hypothetical protein